MADRGGMSRAMLWWAAGTLVLLLALAIAGGMAREKRERDTLSDTYYCTLSGVLPTDRAPATGRRCVDLLDD